MPNYGQTIDEHLLIRVCVKNTRIVTVLSKDTLITSNSQSKSLNINKIWIGLLFLLFTNTETPMITPNLEESINMFFTAYQPFVSYLN